jgi:hypothetical protein
VKYRKYVLHTLVPVFAKLLADVGFSPPVWQRNASGFQLKGGHIKLEHGSAAFLLLEHKAESEHHEDGPIFAAAYATMASSFWFCV